MQKSAQIVPGIFVNLLLLTNWEYLGNYVLNEKGRRTPVSQNFSQEGLYILLRPTATTVILARSREPVDCSV